MIVVSDSSPLNYLIRIQAHQLLEPLFGRVFVPPAVIAELDHANTPEIVKSLIKNRPGWLRVQAPSIIDDSLQLDAGEIQALALAEELHAGILLIDDRA